MKPGDLVFLKLPKKVKLVLLIMAERDSYFIVNISGSFVHFKIDKLFLLAKGKVILSS